MMTLLVLQISDLDSQQSDRDDHFGSKYQISTAKNLIVMNFLVLQISDLESQKSYLPNPDPNG